MKAYSNMETGYINEGEISIFPTSKKFYFYLNPNKKSSSLDTKEKNRFPTGLKVQLINYLNRRPAKLYEIRMADAFEATGSNLRQEHPTK